MQITVKGGAFSIRSSITSQKSLRCGVKMEHWPNVTPVLAKRYLKLWGNDEMLNFLIFVVTNYCELKPFSEMVL